jgi:hypothetical protein
VLLKIKDWFKKRVKISGTLKLQVILCNHMQHFNQMQTFCKNILLILSKRILPSFSNHILKILYIHFQQIIVRKIILSIQIPKNMMNRATNFCVVLESLKTVKTLTYFDAF